MLQSSHHNNMTRDVFITLSRVRIDGGVRVVAVSYYYSWGLYACRCHHRQSVFNRSNLVVVNVCLPMESSDMEKLYVDPRFIPIRALSEATSLQKTPQRPKETGTVPQKKQRNRNIRRPTVISCLQLIAVSVLFPLGECLQ